MREEETLVGLYANEGAKGYGSMRSFAPGEVIIAKEEGVDCIHMLLSGVAISPRAKDGKETVHHHRASTINGEEVAAILGAGYFIQQRPSRRPYTAASDCIVVSIDSVKLRDLYTDGQAFALIRDMIRNADPEVERGVLKSFRKELTAAGVPEADLRDAGKIFSVPEGSDRKAAERYRRACRSAASKVLYKILRKRMSRAKTGAATLVDTPVHRAAALTMPPPHPGSPGRAAWEASRKAS